MDQVNFLFNASTGKTNRPKGDNMKLRIAGCLIGICLLGCEPKTPGAKMAVENSKGSAQAHDAPKSLPDAVKILAKHIETINKAFNDKKPEDAHGSLHDFEHVLEATPALAKDLSDEKKASIKKSVDELLECYHALDETLHGGPETTFSKIEERLAAAMADLKSSIE